VSELKSPSSAGSVGWSWRSPCASAGSWLREVGAALALSDNGTRELRRLGLGEQVERLR
jgi:hypothetical protein